MNQEVKHIKYASIYEEYFSLTKVYKEKYTVSCILLEVGSFFELYTFKNIKTDEFEHPHIKDISEICNLNLVEKKNLYENKHSIYMMGFRNYMLEKYVEILVNNNYTVIVYIQEKDPTSTTGTMRRVFNTIYSIGTFINTQDTSIISNRELNMLSNNIMSIWFELHKGELICGVSTIGIITGTSTFFEFTTHYHLNPTTFDELERAVDLYSPCEVLFISPFNNETIKQILQYSKINTPKIHFFNTDKLHADVIEEVENCQKQTYIKYILTYFFKDELYYKCSEFNEYNIATQSYCFLLNFIKQHNSQLIQNISFPTIINTSYRVVLPNHTLMQLNIIDNQDSRASSSFSSVLQLLNKTSSIIGKRRFKSQLLNPIFDEEWLNIEYENIDIVRRQPDSFISDIRKTIQEIRDIEKIARQIVLKKASPSIIYQLYETIKFTNILQEKIKHINFCNKLSDNKCSEICNRIMDFISKIVILENCRYCISIHSFDEQIISSNISVELDVLQERLSYNIFIFSSIKNYFNKLLEQKTDTIKEHTTDKNNRKTLQLTKTRAKTLKSIIDTKCLTSSVELSHGVIFNLEQLKMQPVSTGSSTYELEHPILTQIANETSSLIDKINRITTIEYQNFLSNFSDNYIEDIRILAEFIGNVDVLQTKAFISLKYNYCRPVIFTEVSSSFFDAKDIRHPLIEHINTKEVYVANNVSLGGNNKNGILLYGVNAAGKTSIIRAIGISLIMAQAGLYVPCSNFVYKPYKSIFSRILGNDNLFKGLSTFQVEMSELRVILIHADENSLVLGDELCSGSEIQSSLSIFVAGLMTLHEKRANYIFATHFFEINDFDEINEMTKSEIKNGISIKHLSVYYDEEKDNLIFDRKLKEGSGSRTYGLEVCKSLYMPKHFLDTSYKIRNKYFGQLDNMLLYKTSVYNKQKVRGICEACNKTISTETHHIREQHTADEHGFIDKLFHKNHTGNLQVLCNECHKKHHK